MNTKLITGILLAAGSGIWVIWNLFANFNSIKGDTISETVEGMAKAAPIIPVVMGVIVGHFFGNIPAIKPVLDFVAVHPIIALMYGIIGGVLFWNMGR
jgi:hypothetical protein